MFKLIKTDDKNIFKVYSYNDNNLNTFRYVFEQIKLNPIDFHFKLKLLFLQTKFESVYIEFPCIKNLDTIFEFIIIDAPEIKNQIPNSESFKATIKERKIVHNFKNLSGDATLISPDIYSNLNFSNIYNFVDPYDKQIISNDIISLFWTTVIENILDILQFNNIWISTSGLCVNWFHLRLSIKPKYYHYPYIN